MPLRSKKIRGPLRPLALDVLGELASKTHRKEDVAILRPLALGNPELACGQIDVCEVEVHGFGIPDPGEEEQFEHDHMGQLTCLPNGLIEGDQLPYSQNIRSCCNLCHGGPSSC